MARTSAEPAKLGSLQSKPRPSDRFLHGMGSASRVVFVSHVQPDPDSFGSMLGLAHLVETRTRKKCILTQDGEVNRAENRAMVDLLKLDLHHVTNLKLQPNDAVVMVDSQPGTGRHSCGKPAQLYAVLDHHVTPGDLAGVPYVDIRPELGATCSLVLKYLIEQNVSLPPRVATALLYGLETELSGYPREGSAADDEAVATLYPHADKDLLARIRNARLPHSHFECLALALQNAVVLDKLIFTWLDPLAQPEQAAEVVDFLVRHDGAEWAICAGVNKGKLVLSVRSSRAHANAGERLSRVCAGLGNAGGHERRAGGCIPITDPSASGMMKLRAELIERIRVQFGQTDAICRPLVNIPPSSTDLQIASR